MKDRYHKKANVLGIDAGGQGGQCINGTDAWKGASCYLFFISSQFIIVPE